MYQYKLWWYDVQNPKNEKETIEVCCLKVGDLLVGKKDDKYFSTPAVKLFFCHLIIHQLLIFFPFQSAVAPPKRENVFESKKKSEDVIAKCHSVKPSKFTECAKILYKFAAKDLDPKIVNEFAKNMSAPAADFVLVGAFLANIGAKASASSLNMIDTIKK